MDFNGAWNWWFVTFMYKCIRGCQTSFCKSCLSSLFLTGFSQTLAKQYRIELSMRREYFCIYSKVVCGPFDVMKSERGAPHWRLCSQNMPPKIVSKCVKNASILMFFFFKCSAKHCPNCWWHWFYQFLPLNMIPSAFYERHGNSRFRSFIDFALCWKLSLE